MTADELDAAMVAAHAADPTTPTQTYHGSRERVSWSVTRNSSTTLFGENEAAARADYDHRRRTLHRGETICLERLVSAEAWVQHQDVIARAARLAPTTEGGTR